MNLQERWHGFPLWAWIGGGTVAGVTALIFVRRWRAAKATNAANMATVTGEQPQSGWPSDLGNLLAGMPGAGLAGYTASGEAVYKPPSGMGGAGEPTRVPLTSGATGGSSTPTAVVNGPTAPERAPFTLNDIVGPFIPAPVSTPAPPQSIATPTQQTLNDLASSLNLPPPPQNAVGSPINYALPAPNTIPGDTSSVVQGVLGGSPFVYGGSDAEAANILNQVGPQHIDTGFQLPAASGTGTQYIQSDGSSFVYG